jgi:GT2 family glycosyltransferase
VAVIVVTHGSAALLPELFTSLRAGVVDRSSRVVVVDSGSTDATLALAGELAPEADVLTLDGNRGYAAGINAGVAHVRSTGGAGAYLLANPDTRPDPGSIDALVDALEQHGVGVACPLLRDQHGARQDSLRRMPSVATAWSESVLGGRLAARLGLPTEVVYDRRAYTRPGPVAWATGGLLAVKEDCSRDVGSWAEHLFLYEEEVDFCLRARARGWATWFVPGAGAVRHVDASELAPWRQGLMRRNRVRREGEGSRARGAAIAGALALGDAVRALAGRREARAGLWSVTHRATPEDVLRRYLPGADPVVSDLGSPPSRGRVVRWAQREPA